MNSTPSTIIVNHGFSLIAEPLRCRLLAALVGVR